MKKFFPLFPLMVLLMLLMSSCAQAFTMPETVRIGLFYASRAKDEVTIGGNLWISATDDFEVMESSVFLIKKSENGFLVNDRFYNSSVLEIHSNDQKISVDGVWYRGYIELSRRTNSDFTVCNVVDVEQYLYSVVGKEMSPSFPIEALKAQAICARNYTALNMGKCQEYGFDMDDTTYFQVYGGIITEANSTINAVDSTRGMLITHNGKPAEVYYFASDGGHTEDSINVWVADLPYLKGVPDPYEDPEKTTGYRWTKIFTRGELTEKFRPQNIGDFVDMRVTEKSSSGRPVKLVVYGTSGQAVLEKEKIRTFLGLSSQMFEIESAYPVTQDGMPIGIGAAVLTGKGVEYINSPSVVASDGVHVVSYSADKYVLQGKGWGHAVGLSQWGAYGMANAGFSYDEILKHYFTGIKIESVEFQ